MPHPLHPDDERLAAIAEADAAVSADSEAARHVAGCERCRGVVDELRVLQSALAELPDVAPSRPLRFLPPVEQPRRRVGWTAWLRGLTAPAMGLAAVLILVGAVGTGGNAGLFSGGAAGASAAAAPDAVSGELNAAAPSSAVGRVADRGTASPTTVYPVYGAGGGSAVTPQPPAPEPTKSRPGNEASTPAAASDTSRPLPSPSQPPFEGILGAGVVLLAAAFVTRGFLSRSAGR